MIYKHIDGILEQYEVPYDNDGDVGCYVSDEASPDTSGAGVCPVEQDTYKGKSKDRDAEYPQLKPSVHDDCMVKREEDAGPIPAASFVVFSEDEGPPEVLLYERVDDADGEANENVRWYGQFIYCAYLRLDVGEVHELAQQEEEASNREYCPKTASERKFEGKLLVWQLKWLHKVLEALPTQGKPQCRGAQMRCYAKSKANEVSAKFCRELVKAWDKCKHY